ncbi:MAG TPA: UbiA family prenyltransferase [Usitatibacter sp.]|nr:UbiA family prenyltransferase [Usitatibacter sp.]
MQHDLPLVVDLDGTLLKSDMLLETLMRVARREPWRLVFVPFWLMRGRASLKRELARRGAFDPASLPYDAAVLEELRVQHASGRPLVLATGSDSAAATCIADHLRLFDRVFASDGVTNLKGEAKARLLVDTFGEKGFEYAGNDRFDLPCWRRASAAIVAGANATMVRALQAEGIPQRSLPRARPALPGLLRAARPHQWAKNLLLFVPLLTAHLIFDAGALGQGAIAFLAFCLAASAVYVANDLMDLEDDRRDPVKRRRPLASGELSIAMALAAIPLLLAAAAVAASRLPGAFAALLGVYAVTSLAYSLWLKRVVMLDVVVLAGLYTLRILAGAAAVQVVVSHWLLAFSVFMFLSLALAKRYVQVGNASARDEPRVFGRGYQPGDGNVLAMFGASSGYISVLVFALYLTSAQVVALYSRPEVLWLACPLLLYWISRVWLLAHRGELDEDPVLFAVHDSASYFVAAAVVGVMALAA